MNTRKCTNEEAPYLVAFLNNKVGQGEHRGYWVCSVIVGALGWMFTRTMWMMQGLGIGEVITTVITALVFGLMTLALIGSAIHRQNLWSDVKRKIDRLDFLIEEGWIIDRCNNRVIERYNVSGSRRHKEYNSYYVKFKPEDGGEHTCLVNGTEYSKINKIVRAWRIILGDNSYVLFGDELDKVIENL